MLNINLQKFGEAKAILLFSCQIFRRNTVIIIKNYNFDYLCCIIFYSYVVWFYVYCADLKDPCVMETAGCHVTLMNAINQSGLMDKYNHGQRFKVIQVQKNVISVVLSVCANARW